MCSHLHGMPLPLILRTTFCLIFNGNHLAAQILSTLELPLQSLPYDHHIDLPFFPPAGNATDAPARAPEGDPEGASVGNSAGIQTSAPEGVSAANNVDVMTGDDNVVPPLLLPGDTSNNHPTTVLPSSHPRCQNVGIYKDGTAKIRRLPIDGKLYKLNILLDNSCDTPAVFITNQGHICCQP
jgi:hypothetical protein